MLPLLKSYCQDTGNRTCTYCCISHCQDINTYLLLQTRCVYLIVVLPSCDLQVQEDYIKDELKNLRTEYLYAQEEVKRIQSVPLVIGQFLEAVDQNYAIVGSTTGE